MAIFDYQPMQPNTPASFYDIAYRRPREMTREDLGLRSLAEFLRAPRSDAPYAFWLGANA